MIYWFERYSLDVSRQELRDGDGLIDIEPQVFDLLHYLIRNSERIVTKDDLIAHVWHGRIVSDSTLTSRITAARQAIGDSGADQKLIRTIARKGIRFVGEIRADADSSPIRDTRIDAAVLPQVQPLPDKPSIAVLPFENMSSDPEQQFIADGIAEDIITALCCYPGLFVIARNSSFSFRGTPVDLKKVGRELGVRYVLEGSLRKSKGQVRITAQLIEAKSGAHVWAERYDCDFVDIFSVQDEITRATTTAIAPAIAQAEQQRAMRKPPDNLDAWAAYQRGLWHLGKGTAEETKAGDTFFRQAIKLDPLFAGGYIGVSAVLSRSKGTQAEEEAMARRAVELDGGNAEAIARLALALLAGGDP